MTTCDKFLDTLMVLRKCGRICGGDIFAPDFHINWVTRTVFATIFFFFFTTAYSAYDGLIVQGDVNLMLQALCTLGSGVSGLCKLLSVIYHKECCRNMIRYITDIYRTYEEKHIGYKTVLNDSVNLISKVLRFTATTYTLLVVFLSSVPILFLCVYGHFIMLTQLILPGIDPSSLPGYIVTIFYQVICLMLGSFGNFAADLLIFIFVLHVPMLKNVMRVKFEDLNEVLLCKKGRKRVLGMLQDIIHWHQEYTSYMRTMSQVCFAVILTQVCTTAFGIAMTVFVTFYGNWPSSPAYLVYSFVILYTYCAMGTVIEYSNDHICDYIYNTCLWYELRAPERKMLVMMLIKAQNPTVLTVGDFMPLSVVAGLSVTKAIYSFMMMLINFTGK